MIASFTLSLGAPTSALSNFDAANLITDEAMSNSSTMTESDIQQFLNRRVPTCSVAMCLKNYQENGQSAAYIIRTAATNSAINPQVLLALLQAETVLVNDAAPTATRFEQAMGYPNTKGFTTQVTSAAHNLSQFMTHNNGTYPFGGSHDIPYNTNSSCGSSPLTPANKATAALYSYPNFGYQPNPAAISADFGKGDDCSTYGIRNWYLYYNTWFNNLIIPTPVYRFWSATYNHHFYTASAAERDKVIATWPGIWKYEGVAYSVPKIATCVDTPPVYRFWSNTYSSHFYTVSRAERDKVIATWPHIWTYEGATYCASPTPTPNLNKPVYRFWSGVNNSHFYTTSTAERDKVIATWPHVWTYEGVVYYVTP